MNTDIKEILPEFLKQAKTTNLRTNHFPKIFNGLNLKVSFGKGNSAKIPWISFLGGGQTTNKGIYPVYLFYKEAQKLILAYGVSEENKAVLDWNLKVETIKDYFGRYNLTPERYGNSYVYKVYDTNAALDWIDIEKDLTQIFDEYKNLLSKNEAVSTSESILSEFNTTKLTNDFRNTRFYIKDEFVTRFVGSLLTKPFVIFTGLSGSGKTKLAQIFATWICEDKNQYCIVPVGADWTNREPLLGFPNALGKNDYKLDEYGVLKLIINANNDSNKPYFLILDVQEPVMLTT
jgi:5-methylcytosine-specific restriction enzyme B